MGTLMPEENVATWTKNMPYGTWNSLLCAQ